MQPCSTLPAVIARSSLAAPGSLQARTVERAPFETIPDDKTIQQRLEAARKKLQDVHSPRLLRIVSYLRISCSAMQKVDRQGLLAKNAADQSITYSSLMKSLYAADAEWWKKCTVTITGRLISDSSVINQLLHPVDAFHQFVDLSN